MDVQGLTGLVGFAFAMTASPGPNNSLVTASGASHGVRRTLPLVLGIGGGIAVSMFGALALGTALLTQPMVASGLKWLGIVYLLVLAWQLAKAPSAAPGTEAAAPGRPLGLGHGVLLQLVNPKVWVMIGGVVVTYGQAVPELDRLSLALLYAVIFFAVTMLCTTGWAMFGAGIGRWLTTARARRRFNLGMALLLAASVLPLLAS